MRSTVKSLIVASLVASSGVYAYSEGFYVGLSGGLSKLKSIKNSNIPILYQSGTFIKTPQYGNDVDTLKFKRGMKFSAVVGYQFLDFRTEVEMSHSKNNYKGFFLEGTPIFTNANTSGNAVLNSVFLNGYYNWNLNSIVTPYIGIGLGGLQVKTKLKETGQYHYVGAVWTPTNDLKVKAKSNSTAYQAILGASMELIENTYLNVDYKFLKSLRKITALDSKVSNHSVNLGIRYHF